MKQFLTILALFGCSLCGLGCGGDTPTDEEAVEEMEQQVEEIEEQLPADL